MQKTNQKDFRIGKVIRRKGDKLYVKRKDYDSSFNSWIDKKHIIWTSEYFPEPKTFGGKVKVELDLSNYATKADLKNATGVDTSIFVKQVDLESLKSNVDKLDIGKLRNVSRNLSRKVKSINQMLIK